MKPAASATDAGEKNLLFSRAEFAQRLAALRSEMRGAKVTLAIFDEIEAMTWISGYGNSENRWRACAVPLEGEPFFLIRALDAGPLRARSWITDITTFRDWEDPLPVLAGLIAERGLARGRIGLDYNSYCMPVERHQRLRDCLPEASVTDIGNVVWRLRLRKSDAETALLRRAAAIADAAMRKAIAACRTGGTKRDAAAAASAAFLALGADPSHVGPISSGRGWDFLHARLDDNILETGDLVHIELVPRIEGYCSRLMRSVSIGPPSRERAEAADALARLQERQIAAMRPGAVARDVDAILRDAVLAQGLRESFDNISGYTLGFYAPAGPRTSDFTRSFHPEARWTIEPDMVFHMYASAQGISFSETVLVTTEGAERLTNLPRVLFTSA
ncbi:MAG: M24 family metallopeptidase [Steroidobacteraceae bacterium]